MSEHTEKYDSLIEKMGGLGEVFHLVPFTMYAIKEAIEKGDEFLNTLPLAKWDSVACGWRSWPVNTIAERVCILKRAAYRMVQNVLPGPELSQD